MTDETQPNPLAEPSPQPGNAAPPADTGVPATPPAADAGAETDKPEDGDGEQPSKPKARGGFQKRIGELTAKNRQLERQLAEATAPKDAAQDDAAPKREEFASYEDYIRAEARHAARQAYADEQRANAERAVATARDERAVVFRDEMENDAAEDPAFAKAWATVTADNFPISPAIRDFVAESDDPHSLIEWLANNRAEAVKLYRADPGQVSRALARVEAKIAATPPARTTQAPPPPPTVGGRSAPRTNLDKLAQEKNPDEYIRLRREQMARA